MRRMPLLLAFVFVLAPLQTPSPPPDAANPGGIPMDVWANLPLIACCAFGAVSLIGILVLIRESQRLARQRSLEEE